MDARLPELRHAKMAIDTSEGGAMEPRPGVFVSSTSADDWVPDPEVPGSDVQVFVNADGVEAGITRVTQAGQPLTWTSSAREVFLVLEGSVRIEFTDGPPIELEVGDVGSLPKGVETTWHITAPFKELWVLS
jgi:uncharacterized cupin superfamily protein